MPDLRNVPDDVSDRSDGYAGEYRCETPTILPNGGHPPRRRLSKSITRRRASYLLIAGAVMSWCGAARAVNVEASLSAAQTIEFARRTGDRLVAIVNEPGEWAKKQDRMRKLIDETIDVQGIARFALGRYWNTANNAERAEFVAVFPDILVNYVHGLLGEHRGVNFTIDRTTPLGGGFQVWTVVLMAGVPPIHLTWSVVAMNGATKIVDIAAEGVSLRITQHNDCASFLARNNSIPAMIEALRRQA